MAKALVIVESPAKAKTINRYLGDDFIVKSSVGHIRDLATGGGKAVDPKERAKQAAATRKMTPAQKQRHQAKKAQQQLVRSMGINPDKDWQANYQILPGKEKVVSELQKLAKKADTIYLATDLDREGEAIAWHLQEAIGGDINRYQRVVFNEITKNAIRDAFKQPGQLNMARVEAQQTRRFLDRVVGYMVSPLLWEKVGRGLSAGRVQSVALRMIVEREREIHAFIPDEYWSAQADLESPSASDEAASLLRFEVRKYAGNAYRPTSQAQSEALMAQLQQGDFVVAKREDKPTSSKPSAPFITSTLQQAASTRLSFGVKKTMMLAQRLYEAGFITYMRTDSTNLSEDAVASCRDFIKTRFGADYLAAKPVQYGSKAGAQEAHEAIRPSNVDIKPGDLGDVDADARKLYQLIWQQFVACQMSNAKFTSTTITVTSGQFELAIKGRVTLFPGFLAVLPANRKGDDDRELPELQPGDALALHKLLPQQHFTKPPPRYSEASLVKELEKRGIGRPSTYAAIISTIQERGYVRVENRRFYAEKIGDVVAERLAESFTELMDYGFTAALEESLDQVAKGGKHWKELLNEFYADFVATLEKAKLAEGGMRPNAPTLTDIPCTHKNEEGELCGRPMMIRTAATGVFLGCSGYSLPPKERCKQTINLTSGDEAVNIDEDEEAESKALLARKRCPLCNTSMDSYLVDEQRKLHVCGNNPDCSGFVVEQGSFVIKGYDGPRLDCDKCGAEMQLKTGRFGKYFGCTECKNTRKLLRSGEAAPPKVDPVPMPELRCEKVDDYYLLRDGASGLFLAASQFPKHRETRAPLVSELLPYKAQIDKKFQFLLDAPVADPDGQPTVVRFDRKTREHYVRSENDGKPSGWAAYFSKGLWQSQPPKRGKK
ncbi:type I DNA topoisomerase [Gammaproteobacteria bacterium LSUCC0057]|uniref:DNA topoisomerase 1 n=1 Tax=Gammaproteobacteria bacterium LSUCC0057 TaxID=2559237 RepID=A0A4Y8UL14_9GAMM|nr:type I DNA topoisomerase [Gammaproteobacteria bacterium LSUCC0057]